MANRFSLPVFQVANPIYASAKVYFYTVDENGERTDTLATLYENTYSSDTLANPQTLDGDGKFIQPVYAAEPVIGVIEGLTAGSGETGILSNTVRYRGEWQQGEVYAVNDLVFIPDGIEGEEYRFNVYISLKRHESVDFSDDLDAGNWGLLVPGRQALIVYYGSLPSDPTTRPDGSAMQDGDLYKNTGSGGLRTFHAATGIWTDVSVGSTSFKSFTTADGETKFELDIAPAGEEYVSVFIGGGGRQPPTAYTVSGTTLTLSEYPGDGIVVDTYVQSSNSIGTPGDGTVARKHLSTGIDGSVFVNPLEFGAFGDGTANDQTAWDAAEAASPNLIYLPAGKTFLLTDAPSVPVWGPGSLKYGDVELGGHMLLHDVARATITMAPQSYTTDVLEMNTPTTGAPYLNLIIGEGAKTGHEEDTAVWRSVIMGPLAGTKMESADRSLIIGDGAARFGRFANRNVILGSIAAQWIGQDVSKLEEYFHEFWDYDPGSGIIHPGEVGWDYDGLETRNAGIGAAIAAVTSAASSSDIRDSVAIGRDSLHHIIKGIQNVAIGNRALAHSYNVSNATAIGDGALHDGVFANFCTAVGRAAGYYHQQGEGNTYLGAYAGRGHITGEHSVFIGFEAGYDFDWGGVDDAVLIGKGAGEGITPAHGMFLLHSDGANSTPLLSGDFINGKLGIGVLPTALAISGPTNEAKLHLHGLTAAESSIMLGMWTSSANSVGSRIQIVRALGNAVGTHGSALGAGVMVGGLEFHGSNGSELRRGASILAVTGSTPGSGNDMPMELRFGTAPDGSATVATRWVVASNGDFLPGATETYNIGSASLEVDNIFLQNAATVSDARRKIELPDYDDRFIDLLRGLKPRMFAFKDVEVPETVNDDGETVPARTISHGRPHTGFFAQEVKEAMTAAGIEDWAGYAYDAGSDTHVLRLLEMISLLVKGWQNVDARVSALEAA